MPARADKYKSWMSSDEATKALEISRRSLERYAKEGRVQRAHRPKRGQKAEPCYFPADVARLRDEIYGVESKGFVLPPEPVPARLAAELTPSAPQMMMASPGRTGEVDMSALKEIAMQFAAGLAAIAGPAAKPKPEKIWLSPPEAARISGLPVWYLRKLIKGKKLRALDVRSSPAAKSRLRILRSDLEKI